MLIKAITHHAVSPNAVEYATIFDNVQHLNVSDTFDIRSTEATGDEIVIHYDGCVPNTPHQQYVCLKFFENGKPRILYSAMPVYVMNDNGKTVESYHPISKGSI